MGYVFFSHRSYESAWMARWLDTWNHRMHKEVGMAKFLGLDDIADT